MEEQAVYEVGPARVMDLEMRRSPEIILDEAKKAARALSDVITNKKKPVIFNGEQYLEFEDWQTVGRFYGITAKVVKTNLIDLGDVRGFEASAVAINTATGEEISAADAMCLNDEPNWRSKPLFQLRSMAQTRACAKCLRNVLAWVVVLAGYRPTPAEEMDGVRQPQGKPEVTPPQRKSQQTNGQPQKATASKEMQDKFLGAFGTLVELRGELPEVLLWELSKFTDKEGKEYGCETVGKLFQSEKWTQSVYGKVQKELKGGAQDAA